jgi:hypothetical protein
VVFKWSRELNILKCDLLKYMILLQESRMSDNEGAWNEKHDSSGLFSIKSIYSILEGGTRFDRIHLVYGFTHLAMGLGVVGQIKSDSLFPRRSFKIWCLCVKICFGEGWLSGQLVKCDFMYFVGRGWNQLIIFSLLEVGVSKVWYHISSLCSLWGSCSYLSCSLV